MQPSQHYRAVGAALLEPRARGAIDAFVGGAAGDDDRAICRRPIVGRGAAYADIDGDGDLDVLLTQTGGRPLLLRNEQDARPPLAARPARRNAGPTATPSAPGSS